jgi:hypothetical protein
MPFFPPKLHQLEDAPAVDGSNTLFHLPKMPLRFHTGYSKTASPADSAAGKRQQST